MNLQLPLALSLNPQINLTNFCWAGNDLLEKQISDLIQGQGERILYVWGHQGSGKSHLLQGCCQAYNLQGSAIYLPLESLKEWGPQSIEGMQDSQFIALDDIDAIAGIAEWEEALFHLYNQVRDSEDKILLISALHPPAKSPIQLPDLCSRLSWGLIMHLHELSDDMKVSVIQQEAHQRGFLLSKVVAQFIVNRCARNLHDLKSVVKQLDNASLAAKRRITIPFIKGVLKL